MLKSKKPFLRKIKNDTESIPNTMMTVEVGDDNGHIDGELIAVISAAVSIYLGKDESGLIIRSIKRSAAHRSAWELAGRKNLMNSRLL